MSMINNEYMVIFSRYDFSIYTGCTAQIGNSVPWPNITMKMTTVYVMAVYSVAVQAETDADCQGP